MPCSVEYARGQREPARLSRREEASRIAGQSTRRVGVPPGIRRITDQQVERAAQHLMQFELPVERDAELFVDLRIHRRHACRPLAVQVPADDPDQVCDTAAVEEDVALQHPLAVQLIRVDPLVECPDERRGASVRGVLVRGMCLRRTRPGIGGTVEGAGDVLADVDQPAAVIGRTQGHRHRRPGWRRACPQLPSG